MYVMQPSQILRSAADAPGQVARWVKSPGELARSARELPGAMTRGARDVAVRLASGAGVVADRAAEALYLPPVVAASWAGALWHWLLDVNRNRIVPFAQDRFPRELAEMEGGDVRIFDSWLEPDPASNTVSLLGLPPWLPALDPATELHLALEPARAIGFLKDTGGPLAPYGNSAVVGDPDSLQNGERWFFVNGIMTNRELARRNAARLEAMFNRQIVTIYNSTQGLIQDLVTSALQKFTNINTEPVAFALVQIARALLDERVTKVVVVAHSRGTIILGDVLDLIYCAIDLEYLDRTNMNEKDLAAFEDQSWKTAQAYQVKELRRKLEGRKDLAEKLELYLFANAASKVCYLDEACRPHIESFANEHDVVTRLGCLAWDDFHRQKLLRIDGPVFMRPGQYGHLLNAHYLPGLERGLYQPLAPPADASPCVGEFVHQRVSGNPCARNPAWQGAGAAGPSRLLGYLERAKAERKPSRAHAPSAADGGRPRSARGARPGSAARAAPARGRPRG